MKKLLLTLIILVSTNFSQEIKTPEFQQRPDFEFLKLKSTDSLYQVFNQIDLILTTQENKRLNFRDLKNTTVNLSLEKVHYLKALKTLAALHNFEINSTKNLMSLLPQCENGKNKISNSAFEKQVNISAILFEANIGDLKERGINWQAILSKHGLRIGSDYKSFKPADENNFLPDFNFSVAAEGDIGPFSGYVNAVLKFLENERLGEIVSRLSVTVRDGYTGRMQVGEDISVKQFDFAGNVTDRFIPTGTIIEVEPKLCKHDSLDFAQIKVHVERSVPYPGEISTSISKTSSDTEIIMKDGEESIISGLLVTEERSVREGVPLLKDLPWWFFGLRYLFGYDQNISVKKEVVILLKIEIVPSVIERKTDKSINLIREKLKNDLNEIEKYKRYKNSTENEK